MKCCHFFSFALVLFLSFFFGFFITINNTFALDDLVLSYSPSSTSLRSYWNYWSACDYDCASQYNYLKIDFFDSNGDSPTLFSRSGRQTIIICGTEVILSRSSDHVFFLNKTCPATDGHSGFIMNGNYGGNIASSTLGYRLTLTDSIGSSPSGDLSIIENGIYDVTNYATVTVDVPVEVIQGDYHDDLVNIQNSIITCGAILLVLYFFYCIYRLIIKNSGVH